MDDWQWVVYLTGSEHPLTCVKPWGRSPYICYHHTYTDAVAQYMQQRGYLRQAGISWQELVKKGKPQKHSACRVGPGHHSGVYCGNPIRLSSGSATALRTHLMNCHWKGRRDIYDTIWGAVFMRVLLKNRSMFKYSIHNVGLSNSPHVHVMSPHPISNHAQKSHARILAANRNKNTNSNILNVQMGDISYDRNDEDAMDADDDSDNIQSTRKNLMDNLNSMDSFRANAPKSGTSIFPRKRTNLINGVWYKNVMRPDPHNVHESYVRHGIHRR